MRHITSFLNLFSLIGFTLIIGGCANFTSQPFYYKTGQQANIANCSGPSWVSCYEAASKKCQSNGYEILEKSSNRVSGFFSSSDYKEIIYVCTMKPENTKYN